MIFCLKYTCLQKLKESALGRVPLLNPTYSVGIWDHLVAHLTSKPTWEGLSLGDQEGLVLCQRSPRLFLLLD